MAGYAVIDFETTGFVPERCDRVVEIGIVLTDEAGAIEDQWTTLINPRRDLGPTHIHGITAAQVLNAPEFSDVAPHVLSLINGRTLVAHNASFDMRFLHQELLLANFALAARPPALCTMRWAGRLIGPAKLSHCCEAVGISLTEAHTALADAEATAHLLGYLLHQASHQAAWRQEAAHSSGFIWPRHNLSKKVAPVHRSTPELPHDWWLERIVEATWVPGNPPESAEYLLCLENALLDRSISQSEGEMLLLAAEQGGLSAAHVDQLHRQYLDSLALEAWADGIITEEEFADLESVAVALWLTSADIGEALAKAQDTLSAGGETGEAAFLREGDRIVFTGTLERPREEWIAELMNVGLVSGGISKSTRVVVTPDPDSLSGKAQKARSYGIPLVDEATFTRMFATYGRGR
ncbi:MAG: hypothetical protein KDA95_00685 [Acidimicrobiales bacterium]|nr:hypothetical protein [Acidimicrobiales bacterium]